MLVSARVDHHEFLISNQKTHSIYHTSLCENAHVSPKTSWFFSIHCHGHLERRIKRHDLHHQKSKGDPPPPNARFTPRNNALISGWLEDDGWLHNPLNTRPLCLFLGILPSMPWGPGAPPPRYYQQQWGKWIASSSTVTCWQKPTELVGL